jgi:hypothetical protein
MPATEANRLPKDPFNSVTLMSFAVFGRNENSIPKFLRRPPQQGKRMPRKSSAFREKQVDIDPSFQAEAPG